MTVIATLEFDDPGLAGSGPGDPDGRGCGLGAGIHHSHHLDRGHQLGDELGQLDLLCGRNSKGGPFTGCFLDRSHDRRLGMTQDQRPPRGDEIDQGLSVDRGDVGARGRGNEGRSASDGFEGANRRVDSSRHHLDCPLKPGDRSGHLGRDGAQNSDRARAARVAKYVRVIEAPARAMEVRDSSITSSPSIHPFCAAASTIENSPDT